MIEVNPILRPVHSFINRDGDYINYILDCPLKKRQFKGGRNKGRYFASENDCKFCTYLFSVTHKEKLGDGYNSYALPYFESVFCNGHNAPPQSEKEIDFPF